MATLTAGDFLTAVRQSGLVPEAALAGAFPAGADLPADSHAAAAVLLRAGLLTGFQARQLLAGKTRGFVLGEYKVLEPTSWGGAVYRAEHLAQARRVLLKLLPADKARDLLAVGRFHRDARLATSLDHPNVVRLLDIGQGGGRRFLVLEHVDGSDLRTLVERGGPVLYQDAARYAAQAAAGLQHAHDKGLGHCDVRPESLVLTTTGVVKLFDAGLTRDYAPDDDTSTGTAAPPGSEDYTSPERAMGGRADERSDVYALGATLFFLVAGRGPFRGTPAETLKQHRLADPPRLDDLAGVPRPFADVVARMLAKRPLDRYQSATDAADALRPFFPPRTTVTLKRATTRLEMPVAPHPPRRRRWVWAAVAAGLLAAVGVAAGVWATGRGPEAVSGALADTHGPLVYTADFSAAPDGVFPVRHGAAVFPPDGPAGWSAEAYDASGEGELRVGPSPGGRFLSVNGTLGANVTQLRFEPAVAGVSLEPGRLYSATVDYRAAPDVSGSVMVQTQGDWRQIARSPLPAGDGWARAEVLFRAPAAGTVQLVVMPDRADPVARVAVRGLTVREAPRVVPGEAVMRFGAADLSPARRTVPVGPAEEFVGGWQALVWDPGTRAEATADPADGVGLRTLAGLGRAVLISPEFATTGRAVVRVEYRTGAADGAVRFLQSRPTGKSAYDVLHLPATDGAWAELEAPFDLQGAPGGRLEFHHSGGPADAPLHVRAVTVFAVPGPPAPAGPVTHYRLDLTGVSPYRAVFLDGAYADSAGRLWPAPGLLAHCWRAASVAEFHAERTDGRAAVGVTNLNDIPTGQFVCFPEAATALVADRSYRARVEYRTEDGAAGVLIVRTDSFRDPLTRADLPPTAGTWQTAEVTFTRPPDRRVELAVGNVATGKGNTLWVRDIAVESE